jgi:peptidoglycan hydrolase-like protein with peptidoglycan-binding domain
MSKTTNSQPPFETTKLPDKPVGGPARIIQICEELRGRNDDGYVANIGGILANIKQHGSLPAWPKCKGTTCTPFTATVIGVAFDPKYPRDDEKDPYVPMFNGGADELMPYSVFYMAQQANDNAVNSVVKYGLGYAIPATQMRRGDLVEITWNPGGGGHGVYCWDVHLNEKGEVDCFQILGSNGEGKPPSPGVSIYGCSDERWLTGHNATLKSEVKEIEVEEKGKKVTKKKTIWSYAEHGNYQKAKPKIFVDHEDIVKVGRWLALPDVYGPPGYCAPNPKKGIEGGPLLAKAVPKGSIKSNTFKATPETIFYTNAEHFSVRAVRCARFYYEGDPPKPYCMKDGAAISSGAVEPPGHFDGPVTTVKGNDIKKDPDAAKKVQPKPAKQDEKKPLDWQKGVEFAMQQFYRAKWIDSDPGDSDNINDSKTQAAIKEFQKKFKLKKVDGIVGPKTRGAIDRQLPACVLQGAAQINLGMLYRGGKLKTDPGPPDGVNNSKTKDALKDFQKASGLEETGVPDADTQEKLSKLMAEHAASESKHGLAPMLHKLYWVGNEVQPTKSATLRLHSEDLKKGCELQVFLKDSMTQKEVQADVKLVAKDAENEVSIPIPALFAEGSIIYARASCPLDDGKALEMTTESPLNVRSKLGAVTETADWRPYIGKDAVPDEVLETIKRNRAKWPAKNLTLVTGKYAGDHHYNYNPPNDQVSWAKEYFQKKVDGAADRVEKMVNRTFLKLLDLEGRPASLQTYDSQIVTWGVGLGAKGDGVHAFTQLNKSPRMKKLLDDLGINYEKYDYQVVDLEAKKVVSSTAGQKGDDDRHIVPLKAWRRQTDLLSAIIGISEDPATREAVAESQYAVYLQNSTQWPGKDKVFTVALFVMVIHMHHWMPAIAKYGFNAEKEFQAIGGGEPSLETDKKLALRIARAFVRKAKKTWEDTKPDTYADVHDRTKSKLWAEMRSEGKAEGFDAGELTYDF